MTGGGLGSRTLDEALLRTASKRLGTLTLIEAVSVFPREKPESVVARFDGTYYPQAVERVELELRAYTNGDFYVTYRERWEGEPWMCRWDRHENPHSTVDHFHEPPAATTADAVDRSFPVDFFAILESILDEIDDRLGAVWEDAEGRNV